MWINVQRATKRSHIYHEDTSDGHKGRESCAFEDSTISMVSSECCCAISCAGNKAKWTENSTSEKWPVKKSNHLLCVLRCLGQFTPSTFVWTKKKKLWTLCRISHQEVSIGDMDLYFCLLYLKYTKARSGCMPQKQWTKQENVLDILLFFSLAGELILFVTRLDLVVSHLLHSSSLLLLFQLCSLKEYSNKEHKVRVLMSGAEG